MPEADGIRRRVPDPKAKLMIKNDISIGGMPGMCGCGPKNIPMRRTARAKGLSEHLRQDGCNLFARSATAPRNRVERLSLARYLILLYNYPIYACMLFDIRIVWDCKLQMLQP